METKILFEDKNKIQNLRNNLENQQEVLQEVANAYGELNLDKPLRFDLLKQLVKDPETTVREIIKSRIPEESTVPGVKNDKDQLIRQVQLPDISQLKKLAGQIHEENLEFFVLSEDLQIQINEETFENFSNNHRTFAKNDLELAYHKKLKRLEKLLNELNEDANFIRKSDVAGIAFDLKNYFHYRMGKLELKPEGFKKFMSNLR